MYLHNGCVHLDRHTMQHTQQPNTPTSLCVYFYIHMGQIVFLRRDGQSSEGMEICMAHSYLIGSGTVSTHQCISMMYTLVPSADGMVLGSQPDLARLQVDNTSMMLKSESNKTSGTAPFSLEGEGIQDR